MVLEKKPLDTLNMVGETYGNDVEKNGNWHKRFRDGRITFEATVAITLEVFFNYQEVDHHSKKCFQVYNLQY